MPEHGSDRMGRDGPLYEIAQWYPRMDVYDDVRGWNTDPYLGQGEFYLEYGDIDFAVTVPAGYVVAGSGAAAESAGGAHAAQRARLATAAHSDCDRPRDHRGGVASAVRDVPARRRGASARSTCAMSHGRRAPDFRWDATSWKGVLTQAYYEWPKAGAAWERAAEQTQWTIRTYSQSVMPFPYPQATSVAGPVGGMEYPMFVMVNYASQESDPNGRSSARSITSMATSGSR